MQVSAELQYSSSAHLGIARQVEGRWQVRGSPTTLSLHTVKVTIGEQSEYVLHTTTVTVVSMYTMNDYTNQLHRSLQYCSTLQRSTLLHNYPVIGSISHLLQ